VLGTAKNVIRRISMKVAERLAALPPYLFARIEQKIEELEEKNVDVISLISITYLPQK
jgi:hypothetical protein